jgi:Putative rhamnosyl transferase
MKEILSTMKHNKNEDFFKCTPTKRVSDSTNGGTDSVQNYHDDSTNWNDDDTTIREAYLMGTLSDKCNLRNMEIQTANNNPGAVMIIKDEWTECDKNDDGSSSSNLIYSKSTSPLSRQITNKNNTTNTTTATKRRLGGLNDSSSCHRRTSPTTSVPRTTTRRVTSPVQALHYQQQQQQQQQQLSPTYGCLVESCNSGLSTDSQNSSSCSSFGGYGYNGKDIVNINNGTLLTPPFQRQHRIVRRKKHQRYPNSFLSYCFDTSRRFSSNSSTSATSPAATVVFHKQQRRQQRQRQQYYYNINSTNSSSMCSSCRINDIILLACTFLICSFMAATSIFIRSGRLFTVSNSNSSNSINVQRILFLHQYGRLRQQHKNEIVISNTSIPESQSVAIDRATLQHHHYLNEAKNVNSNTSMESKQVVSDTFTTDSENDGSINADKWTTTMNQYGLVHVIQTRFMQYQPDLLALGKARLQLFQSITIPSIAHQTNPNFLWIIRTDPNLHESILNPLLETLRITFPPNSNISVVLIASNSNPEGFRDAECIHDLRNVTTLFGDYNIVYRYHTAAQTHTVLETRLDADDAIASFYIDTLQQSASTNFHVGWMVWCIENHMEWQYTSPWNHTTPTGAILGLKAVGCITPGLTWGYTVQSNRSSIPVSKHNKIATTVPLCHKKTYNKKNLRKNKYDPDIIKNGTGTCLYKLGNDILPAALRGRTPTSAGMDHVLLYPYTIKSTSSSYDKIKNSKWRTIQNEMFDSLPVLFGINATSLLATRLSIQHHLPDIASDAYNGQCTKGHSCKQSAKDILFMLMNSTTDNISSVTKTS